MIDGVAPCVIMEREQCGELMDLEWTAISSTSARLRNDGNSSGKIKSGLAAVWTNAIYNFRDFYGKLKCS